MSLSAQQVGVPLASSGLHLKLIGFWGVIVVAVLLAGAFLVRRARAGKER